MTQSAPTNFGYIFVEDKKQYFSFSQHSYFSEYSYAFKNNEKYISLNNPKISILGKTVGTFKAFNAWIEASILSEEDKNLVRALFKPFETKKYVAPMFNVTKKLVPSDMLQSTQQDFTQLMEKNLEDILAFQQNVKTFQKLLKKYHLSPDDAAFSLNYFDESSYNYDVSRNYYKKEIDKKDYQKTQNVQLSSLFKISFLTPTVIKNANYLHTNSAIIYNSFKSKLEDKAQTDGLFVVYSLRTRSNKSNETFVEGGFVNKNNYAGSLNEAEIFYDENRAIRACKARGIRNYQIWDVSMHFNSPKATTQDFVATEALSTILARQEKEFIDKAMEMHAVVAMRQKIEQYEEILKTHNLLPLQQPEKIKSKNKI